tara:strand:+ start:199 stop:375 length:177 start_codon:yes stop_codon:yes gene_type:complete
MKTTGVKKIMKDFEKENLAARLKRVKHNKVMTMKEHIELVQDLKKPKTKIKKQKRRNK